MPTASTNLLVEEDIQEINAESVQKHARSNPARIPCPGPQKGQGVIEYIESTLLPIMTKLAQAFHRSGNLADCTVNVEQLRPRRRELIEYCRDHRLKLPDELRDESGNAPVGDWLALTMTYLALPSIVTIHSFKEGPDNVPYIRLTLS
jgi:hypothetical protein